MNLWKIYCMEDSYPGLWRHWFRNQCVAVGWPPEAGFRFVGPTANGRGWKKARMVLREVQVGDLVIVSLRDSRVGRIGQVTELRLEDSLWSPLVPPRPDSPEGEQGRRINVRWDLTCGPDNRDFLVQLPTNLRFKGAELRQTIVGIRSHSVDSLRAAMEDTSNWVGLLPNFRYERALSDYIAAYPHRVEDGLVPYPDAKVRERVFKDKTRLDVLLLDRDDQPVIVECKQFAPTSADVAQLRGYLRQLQAETGRPNVRGMLVHGGSRKLRSEVAVASKNPPVEILSYRLDVEFASNSLV